LGRRLTTYLQERCPDISPHLHNVESDQAPQRCPVSQRTAPTNRLLGIPRHVGRNMYVGKYRRQPTIQAQPFMARGRHGVKHTNLGHGRLVRQEKGSRFMRSRMDYMLQQNRAKVDRHILGEVTIGEFIPSGNAWPVCLTPTCQSAFRVL
jgi:hypothetical protein